MEYFRIILISFIKGEYMKIKNILKVKQKLFVFLLVFSLIGILSGSLLSVIINSDEKKIVIDYLNNFLMNINSFSNKETLLNTLFSNLGIIIIIYLLGISVIGFIIILFILFGKSFIMGFSIASFINVYKIKGIIYMFIYIFPHQIINLLLIIVLSAKALTISFKMICNIVKEKKIDMQGINKYTKIFLLILFIVFLLSLYEVYIMPDVFTFILNTVKI